MALKFTILAGLIAVTRASVVPAAVAAPLVAQPVVAAAKLEEFDPIPQYNYGYSVSDAVTGDFKSQTEQRNGDLVQGQYSLVEPDGTRRVVDYAADSLNGFNAVVRKEPLVAAAPAVVAQPAVVPARIAAAPVAAAPVAAAPVVAARYAAYTAPVARYAAYTAPVAPAYPAPLAAYTSPFARLAAAPLAYPAGAAVVV